MRNNKLERIINNEELENISTFVHGALFGLHTLGIFYNLTKGRYRDAAIHSIVAAYDITATLRHYKHKTKLTKHREYLNSLKENDRQK